MAHLDLFTFLPPWIGKTSKMLQMFFADQFRERGLDLTMKQFILLKMLMDDDGQMQNNLAMITERDKTSLTRLISTMEKKELVTRIPSTEDRRVNKIYLTKSGRKIYEVAHQIIIENMSKVHHGISDHQKSLAISVLAKIQDNISK